MTSSGQGEENMRNDFQKALEELETRLKQYVTHWCTM